MKAKEKVSVVIVINENNEILALKRSQSASGHNGLWNFPGGGVEDDESIYDAAIRELYEEAGLKAKEDDLIYFETHSTGKLVIHYFITNKFDGQVEINKESSEYKWAKISEIKKMDFVPLTPNMFNDIEYYMESIYEQ